MKTKTSNTIAIRWLAMGLALSVSWAPEALATAGGVGNGGGAWICQNADALGTIRWAKLVDLYEGRTEFGLTIPNVANQDYLTLVDMVMVRRLFTVNQDLYQAINHELEIVKTSLVPVDADLEVVDDALYRIKPEKKECLGGTISYVQLANYTDYGKILIQKGVFEDPHLSETDKAALLIHEAVYAHLRNQYGATDSVTARKIIGLLFSTLPQEQLSAEIQKLLGRGFGAIGMEFVPVNPGSFLMGSSSKEESRDSDEKQHLVQIRHGFEMQTTEVTQAQWVKVRGTNPSKFQRPENCPGTFRVENGISMCPNHPVDCVSYDAIQLFLVELNATRHDGYTYRLPTEAEWEYAARAGTSTAYSFGNDSLQLPLYGWFAGNSGGQTHEVAQLKPNALDLYDMHGNVWEWVSDWYGDYDSAGQIDPQGNVSGSYRVIRGGSWGNFAQVLRSAARSFDAPDNRSSAVGFRLVRTPAERK